MIGSFIESTLESDDNFAYSVSKTKEKDEYKRGPHFAETKGYFDCEIREEHHSNHIIREDDKRIRKDLPISFNQLL